MGSGGVEQIMRKIEENSPNENITAFLKDLIWDESENQPERRWKDDYKKKVKSICMKGLVLVRIKKVILKLSAIQELRNIV